MDQTVVDAIVAGVDYTTIIAGIGSIAAVIMGVLVAKRGARMLMSMIGR